MIKRARESIQKGESGRLKAVETHGGSSVVYGEKQRALDLISTLGSDVKQADGKFRFIISERVAPFFVFLHVVVESLINPTNISIQKGNVLIDSLEKL